MADLYKLSVYEKWPEPGSSGHFYKALLFSAPVTAVATTWLATALLTTPLFAFIFLVAVVAITPAPPTPVAPVDTHLADAMAERQPDTGVVEIVAGVLCQDGR